MSAARVCHLGPVGTASTTPLRARAASLREDSMTRTPSAASASAVARPRPREPATTSAALPGDPQIHPEPF